MRGWLALRAVLSIIIYFDKKLSYGTRPLKRVLIQLLVTSVGLIAIGIGAGCELYYFPQKHLYYFIAISLGAVSENPLHKNWL